MVKYTIQKKKANVNTLKGAHDVGHWNKKIMPGTKCAQSCFCVDCVPLLAAGIHVVWALYWRPSWHSSWCWRWRLFSPIQRVSVVLAFARACVLLAFAYASVVLVFTRVSVVLVFARVSVVRAFVAGVRLAVAGIRAGVCFAVVLAFAWVSVVLPFALASVVRAGVVYLSRVVGAHATIRTTVKSIVSN
jgi:hypothetical protein